KKIDFSLPGELAALPGEPLELEEELHAASVTNPMAATASDADLRTDMDAPDGRLDGMPERRAGQMQRFLPSTRSVCDFTEHSVSSQEVAGRSGTWYLADPQAVRRGDVRPGSADLGWPPTRMNAGKDGHSP